MDVLVFFEEVKPAGPLVWRRQSSDAVWGHLISDLADGIVAANRKLLVLIALLSFID